MFKVPSPIAYLRERKVDLLRLLEVHHVLGEPVGRLDLLVQKPEFEQYSLQLREIFLFKGRRAEDGDVLLFIHIRTLECEGLREREGRGGGRKMGKSKDKGGKSDNRLVSKQTCRQIKR